MSLAQVGMFGWIPFLAADLGAIGTSAWSDWLVRRGKNPFKARKIMLTTGCFKKVDFCDFLGPENVLF